MLMSYNTTGTEDLPQFRYTGECLYVRVFMCESVISTIQANALSLSGLTVQMKD